MSVLNCEKSSNWADASACVTAVPWDIMSLDLQRYIQKCHLAALYVGYRSKVDWRAALPGADFITPSAGSSLSTARPGNGCSPLLQGAGLLCGHFSRTLPWLVVLGLQMKGFGKHSSTERQLSCVAKCFMSLEYWWFWDSFPVFLLFCGGRGLSF